MSWIDGLIAAVLLLSLLFGAWRGLVREAIGLAAWVAAFWLAWRYGAEVAGELSRNVDQLWLRRGLAYGGIFVLVLIAGGLLGWLATKLVRSTPLSGPDHWLGAALGLARGLLIVSAGLLLASLQGAQQARWWRQSLLIPPLTPLVYGLQAHLPQRWLAPLSADRRPPPNHRPSPER